MKGFIRPTAKVLPNSAVIPRNRRIDPAPNIFTHTVTGDQPYSFGGSPASPDSADGTLAAGSSVILVRDDGDGYGWIIDARGLYLRVATDALEPIKP